MSHVAVIDVETTGINPWRHDRIVEIAVVVMHPDGRILREFISLVNPERDMGPTRLHGLSAGDVLEAPCFREVAGTMLDAIDGCVAIAGHNVQFDHSFLTVEFDRMGYSFPAMHRVCTRRLGGGGTLTNCCREHGIIFSGEPHAALYDASPHFSP